MFDTSTVTLTPPLWSSSSLRHSSSSVTWYIASCIYISTCIYNYVFTLSERTVYTMWGLKVFSTHTQWGLLMDTLTVFKKGIPSRI